MKPDAFQNFHPFVNFTYFALVLGFTMASTHPAAQMLSLACALLYAIQCEGRRAVLFSVKFVLPLVLLAACVNPAFNHQGSVILCHLPSGNPLTLESLLYGLSAAAMFASVLLWFLNFNRVFTSDKLACLLGNAAPALSLVLSMTLRFAPRFKEQFAAVSEAQKCMGQNASFGRLGQRLKSAAAILSVTITWSLENAIETADSMKSRGYGLKGRTSFSIYTFDRRDKSALCLILSCGGCVATGLLSGALWFRYFPSLRTLPPNALTATFLAAYFTLCIFPVVINARRQID